jgi:hypothetical protein
MGEYVWDHSWERKSYYGLAAGQFFLPLAFLSFFSKHLHIAYLVPQLVQGIRTTWVTKAGAWASWVLNQTVETEDRPHVRNIRSNQERWQSEVIIGQDKKCFDKNKWHVIRFLR